MDSNVKNFFRAGLAWLYFFGGVGFYIVGYTLIEEGLLQEVFLKVGDVLVIGVILGYLTNISAFFGVFKKDLEDIMFSKKFISVRNDLDTIWETVTKELFKSKFPAISRDLLNLIKEKYLPLENVSYYHDYNISTELSWHDFERKIIKSITKISFDLIAEDRNKFTFPIQTWTDIEDLTPDEYSIKIISYQVNGNAPDNPRESSCIKNNRHEYSYLVDLSGELRYDINQTFEKYYSFEKDFTLCFKARYIINRLNVQLRHPSNLKVCFMERGTAAKFKEMNNTNDFIEMKYKDLLLPEQGYIIAMKEIN